MPTYHYGSTAGCDFEPFHKMSESLQHCTECGAKCKKVPTAGNFKIKGYSDRNGYSRIEEKE